MHTGYRGRRWLSRLFAGAGITVLAATPAPAQVETASHKPTYCPPAPCPPGYQMPGATVTPWSPGAPSTTTPGTGTPGTPSQEAPSPLSVAPESSALALSGGSVAMAAPGYVDFAVPITQFRTRVDAAYSNNRPDRAEFFYSKCGCFGTPDSNGPPLVETNVDSQEVRSYIEIALSNRFSTFLEAPWRYINPDQNTNEQGFSNLLAGFKYAAIACPDHYLTFQFTTSLPTADADEGLGNQLVALEPGFLWYRQLSDRLAVHAELRDWIPLNGSDFAGNILRSGTAVSYVAYSGCKLRIIPISEVVGWTVLSGKELAVANPGVPNGGAGAVTAMQDAAGDTIINGKLGVRLGFGPLVGPANLSQSELYIGYGRALTGEYWYKDLLRVEFSRRF